MKSILPILLVFLFYFCYAQKPRDTIRELQREKEAEQKDLKKCNNLKNDFKDISFKRLEKKIVDQLIFDRKSIIINYRQPFSKYTTMILDPFDYTPHYCNYWNPAYNQSDFWNKRTVRYLHRKFNINIIPFLPEKGQFINVQNVKFNIDKNDKAILIFLKQKKTEILGHFNANEGEKYHFFHAKGYKENKLNLSEKSYQEFEINFRNYLGKIVTVRYTYDDNKEVYKTFQYKLKKWIEIPTKDEYKF
ncbi:hypothetical protein MQX03_19815 [Chryseobacterium aahli]|uniref:hypothetical protein n=1 Tax=Chryseobacterium aahli TaxID=1278643 RepID=UPI001F622B5B|nr:hypothetical protein [Chryseobacterium aahli]MCI3939425.1 hypothetical protein [Chryseobacterium aahli]